MVLESLRSYFWLWMIVGVVLASVLLIVIFVLVIKCIFKREKLRQRSNFSNSKYEDRNISSSTHPTKVPNTAAQSYENLSEAPNWSLQHQENNYGQDSSGSDQDPHDYELVGPIGLQDHVSEHSLPDYVSVDASTEDYDDIGGDDEAHSEEDYDDLE